MRSPKSLLFFVLTIILTFAPPAFAVVERDLPNGIKVLLQEDHKAPLAVFQIWYRVGSRDEISGRAGISHLLEHMMFKGTEKHGSKELSRTVQRHGGTDNAFTSRDYTAYFQILPSDKMDLSIEFESDRMRNLLLDGRETVAERSVVMEERRLRYEDDPQSSIFEEAVAAAFEAHPYRQPVIGWMSSLGSITPEDLASHYRKFYSPDNAYIVVVGDIDAGDMIEKIAKAFGGIEPGPARESYVVSEPPQKGERRVYLKREAELPYVIAMYHAPVFPERDAYALEVLNVVLSGGKSSRLYRSLVYEKKLAISAFSDYSGVYRDPFLFFLGGTAAPGVSPEAVEDALYAEVEALKARGLDDFELQKAKNQIEAEFIMGQDSIFYQAMLIGRFEAIGDWRLKDSYIEGIRGVTAEDLKRVAEKYIVKDNRTVGVMIPEAGKAGDE